MSSYGAVDLSGTIASAKGVAACRPRSLTVYGSSTQDGTPAPEAPVAIESVDELALWTSGKNMLDLVSSSGGTSGGVTMTPNGDGTFAVSGTATQAAMNVWLAGAYSASAPRLFTLPAGTYTVTDAQLFYHTSRIGGSNTVFDGNRSITFALDEDTDVTGIRCPNAVTGTTYDTTIYPQLELGSTATAYQPYVGTVTPIDLQGYQLRSLPDGTRDELTVDAQGNVTLTQRVGVTTQATTDGISATVGTDAMSTTGDLSDGATVIYRLATPQTIGLGTVELPMLPSPEFTAWTVDPTEFEIRALLRTGHSPVMWDGEELSAGWVFVSDRHEQLLPRNVTTIDVPGRDGAIFGGVTQAVRQLTLSLYVLGRPDERAEHVRELAARLAVDGPRPLRFGDELTRMAIPNADQDGESFVNAERFEVTFTCPDPWLYGEVRTATIPSGGSVEVEVGGTAPTWPTIECDATGGTQDSWVVTLDGGPAIYAAIPSGTEYEVTADCGARTIMVNREAAMLPPAYDWPRLTPGSHTLTMTQGTGDATVTWQERWW